MMWYVAAEPCRVSAPCVGVRDPGGTERFCRRCTSLAFRKVLFSLTFYGHFSLVPTSRGAPLGVEALGCLVIPWVYK
jgi:hypothetical protein